MHDHTRTAIDSPSQAFIRPSHRIGMNPSIATSGTACQHTTMLPSSAGTPMPALLFPVRNKPSANSAHIHQGLSQGTSNVRWVGMTPLELVEMLASTTEEMEALHSKSFASSHPVEPICVNKTMLSQKTPSFPPTSKNIWNLAAVATGTETRCRKDVHESSNKRQKLMYSASIHQGNYTKKSTPLFVSSRQEINTYDMLPPWDLSFIHASHTNIPGHIITVQRLKYLAGTLEAMPTYRNVLSSYRHLRDHFCLTYGKIQKKSSSFRSGIPTLLAPTSCSETLLGTLYNEAIQKMEALIELAHRLATENVVAKEARLARGAATITSSTATTAPPPAATLQQTEAARTLSKKQFTRYMTNWIRDNWTNPYPDDDGLAELACDSGTTPTVVGNWLINARTRKWRPAIVKAYDMGRPADLLHEDSRNVFDGKPVREVQGLKIIKSRPLSKKRKSQK